MTVLHGIQSSRYGADRNGANDTVVFLGTMYWFIAFLAAHVCTLSAASSALLYRKVNLLSEEAVDPWLQTYVTECQFARCACFACLQCSKQTSSAACNASCMLHDRHQVVRSFHCALWSGLFPWQDRLADHQYCAWPDLLCGDPCGGLDDSLK